MKVDTFKAFCLIAKTKKGKEIRNYYLKLEEVLHETLDEESKELREQLEENETKVSLLEMNNKEQEHKLNLLLAKTNKHILGESLYILHSTIEKENGDIIDLYKPGKTKNLNNRDKQHKISNFKGVLLQIKCVKADLLEKVIHFLLDKYRCTKTREWFTCSLITMKNTINYAKLVIESNINFEQKELIQLTNNFIETIKGDPTFITKIVKNKISQEKVEKVMKKIEEQ